MALRVHIQHLCLTETMVSTLRRVPFGRTQKEPKGPRPIVRPSLRSGSLAPDLLRGHAATGHPWPRRGSPGIHAGRPTPQHLLSASREGWQIKNTAPRGGRPAGLFGQFRSGPGPGVRLVVLCGRLAPTLLWACSVFGIFCWWKWYCWTRSKSKPGVSPCRATL